MKKMIDNEKAMKLLQFADDVDFSGNEMTIEGKLNVGGNITAESGITLKDGTILSVPSAGNIILRDDNTNLEMELASKQDALTIAQQFAVNSGITTAKVNKYEGYNSKIKEKQDTLVSGTNIKTINGTSLLGSGDMTISGGGSTYTAGAGIKISDDAISVDYDTSAFTIDSNKLKLGAGASWILGSATTAGAVPQAFGKWVIRFSNDSNFYTTTDYMDLTIYAYSQGAVATFSRKLVVMYNALTESSCTSLSEVMVSLEAVWTAQTSYRQNLAKLLLCVGMLEFEAPKEIRFVNGNIQSIHTALAASFNLNGSSGDLYYFDVDEGSVLVESASLAAKEYQYVFCTPID